MILHREVDSCCVKLAESSLKDLINNLPSWYAIKAVWNDSSINAVASKCYIYYVDCSSDKQPVVWPFCLLFAQFAIWSEVLYL